MDILAVVVVTLAGVAAGIVNTAIGSGSLITYPALLLAGLPPVVANITNTIGVAPGAVAGAWAYRRELKDCGPELVRLVPASVVGAIAGAALVRVLPGEAFSLVVPILVLAAAVLVGVQPILLKRRGRGPRTTLWWALSLSVFGAGVYGGYFSAAQGVILLGVLGIFLRSDLQTQNALKNALAACVNVVAAIFFLVSGGFDLPAAACVAIGSLCGAPLGAYLARRLPVRAFRIAIVAFGVVVAIILVLTR